MRSTSSWLAVTAIAALLLPVPGQSQPDSAGRQATEAPPAPATATPETEPAPWPSPPAEARGTALPWPRIEQVRRGNRVVEVRVTDAQGDLRYTMVNRDGRPPLSSQELSSGLSTPSYFKFEF